MLPPWALIRPTGSSTYINLIVGLTIITPEWTSWPTEPFSNDSTNNTFNTLSEVPTRADYLFLPAWEFFDGVNLGYTTNKWLHHLTDHNGENGLTRSQRGHNDAYTFPPKRPRTERHKAYIYSCKESKTLTRPVYVKQGRPSLSLWITRIILNKRKWKTINQWLISLRELGSRRLYGGCGYYSRT